jgi:uncharacterized protein YjbJ (UPF0337 family)
MVTQQQLKGSWREIVGGIKRRWGNLTDDELTSAEGSVEQLVGLIQRKTGEAREKIEQYIDQLAGDGTAEGFRETAKQYVDTAKQYADQARESLQSGYVEAERMLKRHPMESVAIAFGAGLIGGLVVGLMIRSR